MDKNKRLYKKFVAPLLFIICVEILLCSAGIIPVASSMNNNSTIEVMLEEKIISNQVFGRYIFRLFLFGPIYNLSIDGVSYGFESNNLRSLRIERHWGTFGLGFEIEYKHPRGYTTSMGFYGYTFRGIIKPNFICGCFMLSYWV